MKVFEFSIITRGWGYVSFDWRVNVCGQLVTYLYNLMDCLFHFNTNNNKITIKPLLISS
jgi:hypothetical protein